LSQPTVPTNHPSPPESLPCTVFDAANGIVSIPMTPTDVTEFAGVYEMTIRGYTSTAFVAFPSSHPLTIVVRELVPVPD